MRIVDTKENVMKNLKVFSIILVVLCILYSVSYSEFYNSKIAKRKEVELSEKIKEVRNEVIDKEIKISQNKASEKSTDSSFSQDVEYIEENSKYYAVEGSNKTEIISKDKALEIASKEVQNEKYQFMDNEMKFKKNELEVGLISHLSEYTKLAVWRDEWKTDKFNDQLMWSVMFEDENHDNSLMKCLYVFLDAKNGDILGAGSSVIDESPRKF